MKQPSLLFLDCETLGLGDAPVWEVAAIAITANGTMLQRFSAFVEHDQTDAAMWLDELPSSFANDYQSRYVPDKAWARETVAGKIMMMAEGGAIVCGSNPDFDMTRVAALDPTTKPTWHYHPIDVPTLVHGYLLGKGIAPAPPWKSDLLSQMVGVDPTAYSRHTAMGDCEWTLDLWNRVTA